MKLIMREKPSREYCRPRQRIRLARMPQDQFCKGGYVFNTHKNPKSTLLPAGCYSV